ncbi:MAG: glycosyltransferase family 2 protein [Candidatus Micrarchaeota archaeon]
MQAEPRIAVIIPAYNEQASIGRVVKAARDALPAAEVLVVDDASTDATARRARAAGARTLVHSSNRGKGAAMRSGLAKTQADVIVFLDADLPKLSAPHVRKLVQPVSSQKADASIAFFENKAFQGFTKMVYEPLVSIAFPECSAMKLKSPLSGQRAYSRKLLRALGSPGHGYGAEAVANIRLALAKPKPRVRQVNWGMLETIPKGAGKKRSYELMEAILSEAQRHGCRELILKSTYRQVVEDVQYAAKKLL